MKKVFCILAIAFGALSMIFGTIWLVCMLTDLHKKMKSEKYATLEKIKAYIEKKLEIAEATTEEVIED